MGSQIQVVKRKDIPRIQSVEQKGEIHDLGELRDFRWSDELREFMPDPSSFSVSWVRLEQGEILQTHTHPVQSMMVVYSGCGEMMGDLCRQVGEGDVIVVPPGHRHGFVGGLGGLACLSIQFGGGLYSAPDKARVIFADSERSLNAVLAYNDVRVARFSGHDLFALLEDGTLESASSRDALLLALRSFVEGGKRLMVSGLASRADPEYEALCLGWLGELSDAGSMERPGEPLATRDQAPDAVLEAIFDWFAHQMYVRDNTEKIAIICLVFGNAEGVLRRYAARVLATYSKAPVCDVVNGGAHRAIGEDLLRNETAETYESLKRIISEAWDMVDAAASRIVELTRSGC